MLKASVDDGCLARSVCRIDCGSKTNESYSQTFYLLLIKATIDSVTLDRDHGSVLCTVTVYVHELYSNQHVAVTHMIIVRASASNVWCTYITTTDRLLRLCLSGYLCGYLCGYLYATYRLPSSVHTAAFQFLST